MLHLGAIGAPSHAVTIAYEAIHLTGNEWEYRYHVSGRDFPTDDGFVIYFSINADLLEDPAPSVADWDIVVIQPDSGVPADGWYDALSVVSTGNAMLPSFFSISFTWNGAGSPGAQDFEIYHWPYPYTDGDLVVLESGETIPFQAQSVPDGGGCLGLLLVGITGLWAGSRGKFFGNPLGKA